MFLVFHRRLLSKSTADQGRHTLENGQVGFIVNAERHFGTFWASQRQHIQQGGGIGRLIVFRDPHAGAGLSGQFGQLGRGPGMQSQIVDNPKRSGVSGFVLVHSLI
jgi:hypothetical protein